MAAVATVADLAEVGSTEEAGSQAVVFMVAADSRATMADREPIAEGTEDIAVMAASDRREALAVAGSAGRAVIPAWAVAFPAEEPGWGTVPQLTRPWRTASGTDSAAERALEPGMRHSPELGMAVGVAGTVDGVIPAGDGAGAVGVRVGDGGGPVGRGAGLLFGIGRRIGIAPGDPGGMGTRGMCTTIRTEFVASGGSCPRWSLNSGPCCQTSGPSWAWQSL